MIIKIKKFTKKENFLFLHTKIYNISSILYHIKNEKIPDPNS
jgi:hypothetical protein